MSITDLADARRDALRRAETLGDQLGRDLREAHNAGATIRELVEQTGYSRRQIYNLMDRKPSS